LAIAAPAFVLRIVFGSASPYVQAAGLLRIWAFFWVGNYLSVIIGASLLGLHQSRLYFGGQLLHALAVAAIALPAGFMFGVRGLITGALVSSSADLLIGAFLLRYAIRTMASAAAQAAPALPSPAWASMRADRPSIHFKSEVTESAA
jgi:hypothetical protein